MLNELSEIKILRKKLNITQQELASISGVSQSLIAKIESNHIDPTYTKVKQIFQTLNSLNEKKQLKAKNIMNKKVIFVTPNDSLKNTIKKMKKHNISQLPVLENKIPAGFISETIILDAIMKNKSSDSAVKDLMKDSPPTITKDANISVVSNLLKYYPLVLVLGKGKLQGLITKADLLQTAL